MVVDSHHHLWRYTDDEFGWIADDCLRRDFSVDDLSRELPAAGVDCTIICEARQCIDETDAQLETAAESEAIAGVIGWLPIAADDFGNLLDEYLAAKSAEGSKKGGLVGLRHVVQDEPDDEFILRPDFMRGVRRLRGTVLVYDSLVFQRQLATAIKFVDAQANDQQFVLDHVGKPMPGREGEWAALVREMAKRDNVACKFSGVVTEVGTGFDSVRRVFDTVLEAFGPNRLMWGSDWPVVTAKMAYCDWKELVDRLVSPLSESERMAILGATAARVYGLEGMK